jgi:hypothetical protein
MGVLRRGELDAAAATIHGGLGVARGLADKPKEVGRARSSGRVRLRRQQWYRGVDGVLS